MLETTLPSTSRLPGGRPFHLLLISLAVSSCGDWLYNVALLALVFERTGSPTWVALTTTTRILPMVLLGPLAGVFADRHNRRRLMVGADLIRAGLMTLLALVAVTGAPIVLAPCLALAATIAATVYPPCAAACTARLVSEEELPRASALRAGIGQGAVVVGPALGAVVLVVAGPALAIAVNGLTFLVSAASVSAIADGPAFRAPERDENTPLPSIVSDIVEGARALRGAPVAVRLIAADALCSAVYGLLTVTLVLVSHAVGTDGSGYAVLMGAFGLGGVMGAVVVGRLPAGRSWRSTLAVALVLVAVPIGALGFVPSLAAALMLAVLAGGGMIVGEVLSEAALPTMLDDEVLARAYGLAFPASIAGILVGSLIAGPLLALTGLGGTMVIAALAVLVIGAMLLHRPITWSGRLTMVAAEEA